MRKSFIEPLEKRSLLAGNVTASVVDGNLILTGDDAANEIQIHGELLDAKSLMITPADGTTLNGSADPFSGIGLTRSVILRMNGGDDVVEIRDSDIIKDLRISLDAGNDTLTTDSLLVRQNLVVYGGDGADRLLITNARVRQRSGINGQDDADQILVIGGAFAKQLRVLGSAGGDFISNYASDFGSNPEFNGGAGADQISIGAGIDLTYDFNAGRQGWRTEFADWIDANASDYQFKSAIRGLPAELNSSKKGLLVSGRNGSDDLFMYLTKSIGDAEGLDPSTQYLAVFEIDVASNAATGGFGVGGSPGDSVYLKAGASDTAPLVSTDIEGINRLNLDHGQQASGGADISLISTIANGVNQSDIPEGEHPPYRSLHRVHLHPQAVQPDGDGKIHLVVGTDSGYESFTTLYYQQINVHLIPLPPV